MFDHFRLYYYGGNTLAVGIGHVATDQTDSRPRDAHIYDLSGRRIGQAQPRGGIYSVGGRKVVVKAGSK